MRYPAAEQLEIIRLVEQSPLPALHRARVLEDAMGRAARMAISSLTSITI